MNLEQFKKDGEAVARELGRGKAIFSMVAEGGDIALAAGGDRRKIVTALATLITNEPSVRQIVDEAVKMAENKCECPACQLSRGGEDSLEKFWKSFIDSQKHKAN